MAKEYKIPIHFTQAYNLSADEKDLDFFDVNLEYDFPLFVDPFLIQKSPIEEERQLFQRFGDFFRFAYDKSLFIHQDESHFQSLRLLLNFKEPKEICLGYTEKSNRGAGPGMSFADYLFKFFIDNSAKRLIKEEGLFPDGKFNPITLEIFIDGLGPDGISDITANIIMDYLIGYTQDQCKNLGIPLKQLPVNTDGFNFEEMEWRGGGYYDLPENPLRKGEAIILVPKRFLRSLELYSFDIESKIKGILSLDPELSMRFGSFLSKKVNEINLNDIRDLFLEEESIFKKYIEALSKERIYSYDFEKDILKLFSIKAYADYFSDKDIGSSVLDCKSLFDKTLNLVRLFQDHCSVADGWKDMWYFKGGIPNKPQREAVMGRIFRGMGFAYFDNFPNVTFEPEVGTGNGLVDFKVIFNRCRIVIELKKLCNSSPKGEPPIPSYLHGIQRQLPDYAYLSKATHAIYITGQHYSRINSPKKHHDDRINEIHQLLPDVEKEIKNRCNGFCKLSYINIDLTPRSSISKI